jgi:hypothetical protein
MKRKYTRLTKRRRQSSKKQNGGAQMKYAVLAIFKNEAMGIAEWVEHYLWQGADMILLLNNNSDDDWEQALAKFDKTKVVVLPAEKSYAQADHYSNIGLPWLRTNAIDIVSVLDIDEYLFCKDGRSLKKYFTTTFTADNMLSYISYKWKMFGSNGFIEQPESIRKSFLCCKADSNISFTTESKVTYLVKDLKDIIHIHLPNADYGKGIEASDTLQLNHYAIQSKEYFEKVKMTRGDVSSPMYKNVRDWKYFDKYNWCDQKDELLKNLLEAHEADKKK